MKKGISLIVLVITIIVMIIIAGAIIISLNNSRVIDEAQTAVIASDVANLKGELTLKYADIKITNNDEDSTNDIVKGDASTEGTAQYMYNAILARYERLVDRNYTVTVNDDLSYNVVAPAVATN